MTDLSGVSAAVGGLGSTLGGVGQTAAEVSGATLGVVDHLVQPGETVGAIASEHGVSVDAVMAANPQVLHPDIIEAGAHLAVPTSTAAAPEPAAGAPAQAPSQPAAADAQRAGPSEASDAQAGPATAPRGAPAGAALPTSATGSAEREVSPLSTLLSAMPRETLSWRVQQQAPSDLPLVARAVASAPGEARAAPAAGALLQALASDPAAAAALARLVGDGQSVAWAVLGARLAQLPTDAGVAPGVTGAREAVAEAAARAVPPGVDLAGREAVRPGARRAPVVGDRQAAETIQAAWIRRCAPAAVAVKARWGVPAGFTIAHGALVSDWGRLAPGNDFFGLLPSAAPGAGRALVALDGPPLSGFDGLDEAADAFGGRLRADGRYALAFRVADAVAFAARLAARGLTPDPLYAPAMQAVIEAHALARFD